MSFSLNEMEATAKRAARGAGYSWGLAEDAAKASRWLCAQGLDGAGELAQLLEQGFAATLADHAPKHLDGVWCGDGAMCSLATGALLSDCAHRLATNSVTMVNIACPTMILLFAANAARSLKSCVTVECDGIKSVTDGCALSAGGDFPSMGREVLIRVGGTMPSTPARLTRATPDPECWAILNRYAHKTYAPATEESRLLGAGAGLSDND